MIDTRWLKGTLKSKRVWFDFFEIDSKTNLLVKEIFCPVDWSTRRSCKSSNNPPFLVVVVAADAILSFVLTTDDDDNAFKIEIKQKKLNYLFVFENTLLICCKKW